MPEGSPGAPRTAQKDTGEPDDAKVSRPVRRRAVGKVPLTGQLVGGLSYARERSAREGVNPQTGEKMMIAAKRVPSFSAGNALKDSIR